MYSTMPVNSRMNPVQEFGFIEALLPLLTAGVGIAGSVMQANAQKKAQASAQAEFDRQQAVLAKQQAMQSSSVGASPIWENPYVLIGGAAGVLMLVLLLKK